MIRNLEEQVLRVRDTDARDYVREAVRCYNAAAYRAAVTQAVAAGMDDLRRKLRRLAESGAGQDVTKAHKMVEKLWIAQSAFESVLIAQCREIDLIGPDEEKKLTLLLKTRHLCAHPSGHKSSTEEALDAITGIIDLVLSRPPLLGGAQYAPLLERLESPVFFPLGTHREIVRDEIDKFHPRARAGFASGLVRWLLGWQGGPPALDNAVIFLGEMILLEDRSQNREAWDALDTLLISKAATETKLAVVAHAGTALGTDETDVTRLRAISLVRTSLTTSPSARKAAAAWRAANLLRDAEVLDLVTTASEALGFANDEKTFAARLPAASAVVLELGWDELRERYLDALINACGAWEHGITNAACRWLIRADGWEPARLSRRQRAMTLAAIAYAIGINGHGAKEAAASPVVRTGGFAEAFRDEVKSGNWSPRSPHGLWPHLEQLLAGVLGSDDLADTASAFIKSIADDSARLWVAREVARSSISEVKSVGDAECAKVVVRR